MDNLGYYNGTFGPIEEMTIPMNDRVCWFGDGVYDAGPTCCYRALAWRLPKSSRRLKFRHLTDVGVLRVAFGER